MAAEPAAPRRLAILGTGSALPGPAISTPVLLAAMAPHMSAVSRALAARIANRLAIKSRHLARSLTQPVEAVRAEDSAPRLAARAVSAALHQCMRSADQVHFLLGHTATPHTLLPSNTAWTADELRYNGPYAELRQACTGFAAATRIADGLLATGHRTVAIVGSETGSVYFDPRIVANEPEQLVNLVQMGDGAGAAILGPHLDESSSYLERPFFGSQGLDRRPGLSLTEGGSGSPLVTRGGLPHFNHGHRDIKENGLDLLRSSLAAAEAAGVDRSTVDWFLPHQANGRMAELCHEYLQLPRERVICEADTVGNLGSAAIWVALDRLRRSKRLAIGDRVLVLGAEATKYLYGGFLYVHGRT